jgi:hypothetical protein
MATKNFRVRKGLTIAGETSGSSNFNNSATGTDIDYILPTAQGAASTTLTNDGSGNLSWDAPGNPFDQSLNTTDNVEFASVKTPYVEANEIRPYDTTTNPSVRLITTGPGTYQTGKANVFVAESVGDPNGIVGMAVNSNTWYFRPDGYTQLPFYTLPAADGTANQVLTTDGSGNVSWQLPGGGGSTFGNVTVGVATDQTISTTTGNLVLDSTSGTITMNSAGTLGVTLNPITGFNPNADFTGNIVKGVIRTGAGEATGDIWQVFGPTAQTTGISIDNTDKVADRTGIVLRNYGASLTSAVPRNTIVGEAARGTAAVPLNLNNGNSIIDIIASGYTSTGWATDLVASSPGLMRFSTAEAWNNGINNVGTNFQVLTMPTATALSGTNLQVTIAANPQSFTTRSDAYNWNKGKALIGIGAVPNMMNLSDNSGKVGLTVNQSRATTGSDFALINFQTQRSTDGINYTATQNNDTLGTFKFNGNAYTGTSPGVPGGPGAEIAAKATENWTATANGTKFNFFCMKTGTLNSYDTFGGNPDSFSINSDIITFKNFDSSATLATINSTAATFAKPIVLNGSTSGSVQISAPAVAGTQTYTLPTAQPSTTGLFLTSTTGGAMSWATLGSVANYIEAYSTQDQTNPTANAENLMSFNNTGISNGISIVTNGTTLTRITLANAGVYNIQFSAQLNQTTGGAHNAFIWLKKNGANVANSAGDTRVQGNGERIMAAWNYVVSAAAGDYYELAWAADDTNVVLDYVAAAGVVPAVASVILTVVPVGA